MALIESSSMTVSCRGPVTLAGRDAHRNVVWLRGEHDVSAVAALWETLARAIALDDADLLVDLSGVEFMDASTVGVINRAHQLLRLRSRTLALRSPSTRARRVLDLCDLADLVHPRPVDARRMTGTAAALGTWLAAPATDRVDRRAEVSSPEPSVTYPVRAERVSAARNGSSTDAHHPPDERTTNVAGCDGP
jgi:anti-sigma B factor antagonist